MGMNKVKSLVEDGEVEKKKFHDARNRVITLSIDNQGASTPSMIMPDEDVNHFESESTHHKRHGKCMSVKRFQKKTGKK
eukprot:12744001-Heterocapsa_arctica.AAC.1